MKKDSKDIKGSICLHNGFMCQYCCGDCIYMDLSSTNKYGEAWCGSRQRYYKPSESARYCDRFKAK